MTDQQTIENMQQRINQLEALVKEAQSVVNIYMPDSEANHIWRCRWLKEADRLIPEDVTYG